MANKGVWIATWLAAPVFLCTVSEVAMAIDRTTPRRLQRIRPRRGGDTVRAIMATEIKERRSELTRVGGPYPPIPSADDKFGISQATRHRTNKRRWTD